MESICGYVVEWVFHLAALQPYKAFNAVELRVLLKLFGGSSLEGSRSSNYNIPNFALINFLRFILGRSIGTFFFILKKS